MYQKNADQAAAAFSSPACDSLLLLILALQLEASQHQLSPQQPL